MFYVKLKARRQISLHRDNKSVLDTRVCGCLRVCVLRIVSPDNILGCISTLIVN